MIDSGTLFVVIFGCSVVLAFAMLLMWHVLHVILCKKYDYFLFKEPYFKLIEIEIYGSWPLSLVRSMGYILLLAAPNFYITKRRFKGVEIERSNILLLIWFSRLFLLVVALGVIFTLAMIVMGAFSYTVTATGSS